MTMFKALYSQDDINSTKKKKKKKKKGRKEEADDSLQSRTAFKWLNQNLKSNKNIMKPSQNNETRDKNISNSEIWKET